MATRRNPCGPRRPPPVPPVAAGPGPAGVLATTSSGTPDRACFDGTSRNRPNSRSYPETEVGSSSSWALDLNPLDGVARHAVLGREGIDILLFVPLTRVRKRREPSVRTTSFASRKTSICSPSAAA